MKNKSKLKALNNDIIFQFVDEGTTISDGHKIKQTAFQEKTVWGFVYKNPTASAETARWGTVIAVGPKVDTDITVGRKVLIHPLKWTNAVRFEGNDYWKTNDEWVLGVDSSED